MADQLGGVQQAVALPVGEVDRPVRDATAGERLDAAGDPVDTVVDVREVERLVLSVHGDRLAARELVDPERQHAHHPVQVVVEPAVHVREAEDEVRQSVAARIRVHERLAGDLRGGVRGLREGEVRRPLVVAFEAVHVAVDLAARGEDDRKAEPSAQLEDVERDHGVL